MTAPNIKSGIRPKSFINGPKTRLLQAAIKPNQTITNP